jgi:hypothetical protein
MYSILTLKTIPVSCTHPLPQIDDNYSHPSIHSCMKAQLDYTLAIHTNDPPLPTPKKSEKCMVTCTIASQSLATSSKATNPIVTRAKIETNPSVISPLSLARALVCVCVCVFSPPACEFCLLFAAELENPTVAVPVVGLLCLGEQRDIDESAERFFKK